MLKGQIDPEFHNVNSASANGMPITLVKGGKSILKAKIADLFFLVVNYLEQKRPLELILGPLKLISLE